MTLQRSACKLFLALIVTFAQVGHADTATFPAVHPLDGKIWDSRSKAFLTQDQLIEQASHHRFVLMGEIHDNAEVHSHQHWLLEALLRTPKRPALVMEMFDLEQQAAIDANRNGSDADKFAAIIPFNFNGWTWSFYRPLVALALRENLPIAAANLSRTDAQRIAKGGTNTTGPGRVLKLLSEDKLDARSQRRLEKSIAEGHCGKLGERAVASLALAQRARDASMAEVVGKHQDRGAVLVAGDQHVRLDYGVPWYLQKLGAKESVLSVAWLETDQERVSPDNYLSEDAGAPPAYDIVWFVPPSNREDPCAAFGKEMGAKGNLIMPGDPPPN